MEQPKVKNILSFKFTSFLLFAICYLLFATSALAQTSFTNNLGNYPGGVFTITNLVNIIRRLACYFIQFGIIAVGVAFLIYGIMFLKSRGNPQEFGGARKSITWGVVGGLVIFGVFTIILTVSDLVGYGATGYTNYPILTIIRCS